MLECPKRDLTGTGPLIIHLMDELNHGREISEVLGKLRDLQFLVAAKHSHQRTRYDSAAISDILEYEDRNKEKEEAGSVGARLVQAA